MPAQNPTIPRRPKSVLVAALALAVAALAASALGPTSPRADAAVCPNEAIREAQGAAALGMPECRAYELVSPDGIPRLTNSGTPESVRAATSGDAFADYSYYPAPGATSSSFFYKASRGADGWTMQVIGPQNLPTVTKNSICFPKVAYSTELSTYVLQPTYDIRQWRPEEASCGAPQEPLVVGEPSGVANLLRRADPGAPYELLNQAPDGVEPANGQFQDGSTDLSHVVFGEEAALTPEAPEGYDLYEWSAGAVRLVTYLPDGSPVRGDLVGATLHRARGEGVGGVGGFASGTATFTNAVSEDGERVFFYSGGDLYVRENAARAPTASGSCSALEPDGGCTVQVDVSRGPGPKGGGIFQYASADGSRVFFTDESKLTYPSSATAGKPDLYEYEVATGRLVDITYDAAEAADVRGFSGASTDGSYLYFVALGALPGSGTGVTGASAQPGGPNLYVDHEGAVRFIATLEPGEDRGAWNYELASSESVAVKNEAQLATRTSPSGRYFAFNSILGLTGIPSGTRQIYLYDAATGELACASCLQGGGNPNGRSELSPPIQSAGFESPGYLPRGLTDGGMLYFSTAQPLVASDTDGVSDVYEYGIGTGPRLISDGSGSEPSYFMDASEPEAGQTVPHDIFFATGDPLVGRDTDNAVNVYDARVDGGFAEPQAAAGPCTSGESCRPAGGGSPGGGTAATAGYAGEGNAVSTRRCPEGKVRRHGRCIRSRAHKRHRKRRADHHHRRKGHHDKANRRRDGAGKGAVR